MVFNKKYSNMVLVFLSICCLAAGGIFVKLSTLGPINTGVFRVLISIPLLMPFLCEKISCKTKDFYIVVAAGIFLGLDLLFWNISFSYTTVANANLLVNLTSFTIIPLSFLFYNERITLNFLAGLALTIVGLFILISGKSIISASHLYGDMLAFMTSVFYAIFMLIVYKVRKKYNAMTIMYYSAYGSLLVLLPAALLVEGFKMPVTFNDWWPLIALALFSQIFGQGGLSFCLGRIKPIIASILVLMQPVISAIYALILFAERLTLLEISGMAIILAGVFWAKRSHTDG